MTQLELPPDVRDDFYRNVWKIVNQIPSGKVSTYGQVGSYIPCPAGISPEEYESYRARWVGNAMAASPKGVPWQRVINSQGKISLRRSADTQRRLLEEEGVTFDEKERVDLKRFGWEGPTVEWLRENGLIAPEEPRQLGLF